MSTVWYCSRDKHCIVPSCSNVSQKVIFELLIIIRNNEDQSEFTCSKWKCECVIFISGPGSELIHSPDDFERFIKRSESGPFYCQICSYSNKQFGVLKFHVESKHFPNTFSYQCPQCDTVLGTSRALSRHLQRNHKDQWILMIKFLCPTLTQSYYFRWNFFIWRLRPIHCKRTLRQWLLLHNLWTIQKERC